MVLLTWFGGAGRWAGVETIIGDGRATSQPFLVGAVFLAPAVIALLGNAGFLTVQQGAPRSVTGTRPRKFFHERRVVSL
jgi:hypothetical protein